MKLARILSPLAGKTDSFVKNSAQFTSDVHEMAVDERDLMVTFDVVSLFTKVPTEDALEVIKQRLDEDETLLDRTPLEIENICTLTELCLRSTYFQYRTNSLNK